MRKIIQLKSNKQLFKKSGLLLIALSLSLLSYSVTKTSTGNGNWNVAGTWSPSGVPSPTDDVIINHAVVLNVTIDIDPGGSVTINTGASLIGPSFGIDFNGSTSGGAVAQLINHGTMEVDNIIESTECSYSKIDNYGTLNVVGSNGTTAVFLWRSKDTVYNHTGATMNVLNGKYHTSNQGWTSCNGGNGKPTTINEGIMNVYDMQFHAGSLFFNYYLVNVSPSPAPGIWMSAWEFHNYGCILGGGIEFNGKSNNSGHNISILHDNSKIYSEISVASSSQTLSGVDDDNNNSNNACAYSTVNITNSGTITGEFNLNDPDGAVPGTVGPNVTLGTGNCGGPSCAAPTCAIDTIRDTNVIYTTDTICASIDNGMSNIRTTIVDCAGAMNNSGNVYTALTDGCIAITRSGVVGYNLDTLCIVKTDTVTGISDTTVAIISNLPKRDTIRDTNVIITTDTVCVDVELGMNADSIYIVDCAGAMNNSGNVYTVIPGTRVS
ncbi:MAG: hypothetical protein IPK18_11290 [Sphingobacteriales bacterium]|nr:MAG: hypothetical protein IPK18_11290 [Sphingobacteriales bacterium]